MAKPHFNGTDRKLLILHAVPDFQYSAARICRYELMAYSNELNGLHILLVDDDPVVLDLMEAMLKALGASHVTRATNGSAAFSKILRNDRVVDVILCDYSMSPGNGLQLLQAVRMGKIKFLRPDSCFILLTGSGEVDVVKAAGELDVSGYIVKPATIDKLGTTILKARNRTFALNMERYATVDIPL
jgi:CheY-like chemotaxis protein